MSDHKANGRSNGQARDLPMPVEVPPDPPIKLAICLPWQNTVDSQFCLCLAEMYGMIVGQYVNAGIADVNCFTLNGTYLGWSRTDIAKGALQWGATHLLWIDSDMTFPSWAFHHLFKQDKDIIGVNYAKRRAPHGPVTFKTIVPPTPCYTEPDAQGLEEVEGIGFGFVLMKASVFNVIPTAPFRVTDDENSSKRVGEDVYFCQQAKAAGLTVYIDHTLSQHIGHQGTLEYLNGHSLVQRKFASEIVTPPKLELVRH